MKIKNVTALSVALLALIFSACSSAVTTVNNSTTNTANKLNTAVVINSNQTAVANNTAVSTNTTTASTNNIAANKSSNTAAPVAKSEGEKIQGELQAGKTESVILYVGMESGDYAAYCFTNDSEAGRAILAGCKDKQQCEVTATTGEGTCKVPGLEADLSASSKILKVSSVKLIGSKK